MKVLIIGRAVGVWEEVEAAKKLGSYDTVVVVGKAGCDYLEPFDHWVSWHWNLFQHWCDLRERNKGEGKPKLWSGYAKNPHRQFRTANAIDFVVCPGGSSGLLAMYVCKKLFARKVVLAGIPMLRDRGHYDEPGPWKDGANYYKIWEKAAPEFQGIVKSMSGWTGGKFGIPTAEWLNDTQPQPSDHQAAHVPV